MNSIIYIFIPAILILIAVSCLSIFISRKLKFFQKNTSKSQTILFLLILSVIAFYLDYNEVGSVMGAIGYVIGFVYLLPLPSSLIGVLIMNKFKINKDEYWNSLFSNLIIVFLVLLNITFLEN